MYINRTKIIYCYLQYDLDLRTKQFFLYKIDFNNLLSATELDSIRKQYNLKKELKKKESKCEHISAHSHINRYISS